MRKHTVYIGYNKDADQLCVNLEADQHLCFRYTDSTIPLLSKSKISSFKPIFCNSTGGFVLLDLDGNPNCWFSHAMAQFFLFYFNPYMIYFRSMTKY